MSKKIFKILRSGRPESRVKKYGILALIVTFPLTACLSDARPTPDFSRHEAGAERKAKFFAYFEPLVKTQNAQILEDRETVLALQEKGKLYWWNKRTLSQLTEKYRFDEFDPENPKSWSDLLRRVDKVPASLVLAQSAHESGWGTSRFAKDGNNYFGQWCYEAGCGLVPLKRSAGAVHEVAKFDSPKESVNSYLMNLNTHRAYYELRSIRASLRVKNKPIGGESLAAGLHKYSTRGDAYVKDMRSLIRHNDLAQYDK